jgi:hypothetical protein
MIGGIGPACGSAHSGRSYGGSYCCLNGCTNGEPRRERDC